MKCPFVCSHIEQIEQTSYDYNDDGIEIFREHRLIENKELHECVHKDCGVFYKADDEEKARCHYNG